MLSALCVNRLENWKFASALGYAEKGSTPTDSEREAIEALSAVFGNCGWFGGSTGVIVGAAVDRVVTGYDNDYDPDRVFAEAWERHLWRWEFESAARASVQRRLMSKRETAVVEALAQSFGDVADFDGPLQPVLWAAIDRVLDGWPDTTETGEAP